MRRRVDAMGTARGFSLLELLLVAIVISVLITVALNVYAGMVRDVRRLGLEIAAHNFITAVMGVRAQWYVDPEGSWRNGVMVYDQLTVPPQRADCESVSGKRIYLTRAVWPLATEDSAAARAGRLTVEHCIQLWQGLLQSKVTLAREERAAPGDYRITKLDSGRCRYQLEDREPYFFDYAPESGEVSINTPRAARE
jgi:prepilin-type N-terminal cleavage/methylation domain-containing protein